jgi:hypothetical protein
VLRAQKRVIKLAIISGCDLTIGVAAETPISLDPAVE